MTRAIVLSAVFALLAVACSGSATTTISEATSADSSSESAASEAESTPRPTQAPEPTAEAAPEPTAEPEPDPTATPEPTPEPEPEQIFFGSDLEPGTCFNRVEGNPEFTAPNVVDCNELHEQEVYGKGSFDAAPGDAYPGVDPVVDLAGEFCDPITLAFAGEEWDQLPYSPSLGFPTEAEWDAGDRTILCFANPVDDVDQKIGTAAGGTLDSDDVLVARAGLTNEGVEFDDWVVLVEQANIDSMGSLTDGQFDLPLRRADVGTAGMLFSAREGSEGPADNVYGYDWAAQEIADFGSFDDDSEFGAALASPSGATVLAARANPDADWDIWTASPTTDFALTASGEGNQRFPTLTPDGTRVVYHDRGNLWIMNLDGSDARQLTSGDSNDWESAVSPDGSTVLFASDRSGNDDIWSVSIEGGEPVNLTNHPADESWPIFSSDGNLIYFSSDRLDPIDDRSRIMMMNPDGSNQSFFANVSGSQANVLPDGIAGDVLALAPTLNERYNYDLLVGEPGTTVAWTHSTGRMTVEAPAGWRIGEVNEQPGFLVAAKPDRYFETWATDGALVLLYDDISEDDFFALALEVEAVQSCDEFDGSGGVQQLDDSILILAANHDCGDDTVGGLLAFYNTETQVGVTIEGQTDSFPSRDEDGAMITAIAQSLLWE